MRRSALFSLCSLSALIACGTSTSTPDAASGDAALDDAPPHADAACVVPTAGEPCTAGERACQPDQPCCNGIWGCDPGMHTWQLNRPGCQCDAGLPPPIPDAAADTPESATEGGAPKRVFVSSVAYTGDIDPQSTAPNGVDDGDKACNALARAAGLGGTWLAFLAGYTGATGSVSAIEHVGGGGGPWYLLDKTSLVFADKASLSGAPAHPFATDEHGAAIAAGAFAWTGGGSTDPFCNAWTSQSPNNTGVVGKVGATTTEWAASASPTTLSCDKSSHLYCFEQ